MKRVQAGMHVDPVALQQEWQALLHHITISLPTFQGGEPVARGKCNNTDCDLCNCGLFTNPLRTLKKLKEFDAEHPKRREYLKALFGK